MTAASAHLLAARRALFLDADGTLLEIAAKPEQAQADPSLKSLLKILHETHDGALALISGRSISQLDRLFDPLRLPSAGMHGLELRDSSGKTLLAREPDDAAEAIRVDAARDCLIDFVGRHPGTLLEDKGGTLALHYRTALQHEAAARGIAPMALELLGPAWQVLEGKCVLEFKPRGVSKAGAIDAFMRTEPFFGRMPVFVGDDRTDESGFEYVNQRGGHSIHVGNDPQTRAQKKLENVAAVHRWLQSLLPTKEKFV